MLLREETARAPSLLVIQESRPKRPWLNWVRQPWSGRFGVANTIESSLD